MADEFQSGVCSGNWWNSERNIDQLKSLRYSTAPNDIHAGDCYGWSTSTSTTTTTHDQIMSETKTTRSSDDQSTTTATSVSSSSLINVFNHNVAQQNPQESDSVGKSGSNILMDSTLQMMGFGLSSSSSSSLSFDWDQNYISNNNQNSRRADQNGFKQINPVGACALDRNSGSGDYIVTCEELVTSFPMDSTLYGCPTSTLLQGLYEPDHHLQPQQASYENQNLNYLPPALTNYFMNNNDFSMNNQSFQFSNNTPFRNASVAAMANGRWTYFPSQQIQFLTSSYDENQNCSNLTTKPKAEEVCDSRSMMKKNSSEPSFKRPRIESPSPLPTLKVRKEKLGDRITVLQQLVSPFGKTDTASVLFEAIEYIKFLHEQVTVLSTPYLKNGAHMHHPQQNSNKIKEAQGTEKDLRSRGLCLVPISSTFPVINETATDFLTPPFGGIYR